MRRLKKIAFAVGSSTTQETGLMVSDPVEIQKQILTTCFAQLRPARADSAESNYLPEVEPACSPCLYNLIKFSMLMSCDFQASGLYPPESVKTTGI